MKIIETTNYKRLKNAQGEPPPPGGAPPGPPPPKPPKKRKFKQVTDEPAQFDNSSVAPTQNNYLNPVDRTKGRLKRRKF